jgi:hypothetical protein
MVTQVERLEARLLIRYYAVSRRGCSMRNVETWSDVQPPVGLVRRVWRRVINRSIRHFYVQGDTAAKILTRMAAFFVGWGCVIGLLTWAGYRNGTLHGLGDGVLSVVVLFTLALISSGGYLASRS